MRLSRFAPLLVFSSLVCHAQTSSNWIVIGVVGKWTVLGSGKPVTFGMPVSPDTVLERGSGDKTFGSVTILVDNAHLTLACADKNSLPGKRSCEEPLPLKEVATHSGENVSWLNAARQLLLARPDRYVNTVSRGFNDIHDAVVEQKGRTPDLQPSFGALPKGEYKVTVVRMDAVKQPVPLNSEPVTMHWDPAQASAAELPAMGPGLYALHVEGTGGEPVGEVRLLVVSPSELTAKTAAYAEMTKITAGWRNDTPASAVRAMNWAALDELAR